MYRQKVDGWMDRAFEVYLEDHFLGNEKLREISRRIRRKFETERWKEI